MYIFIGFWSFEMKSPLMKDSTLESYVNVYVM
jgi:hypothetical protein